MRKSTVGSQQSSVGSRQSSVGSRQSSVGSQQSSVGSQKPFSICLAAAFAVWSIAVFAQGRGGVASFPAQQRDPADPAVVARGRAIYDTDCRSCHGADLRGGEQGGSNLLRATPVLNDREGELIQQVLQASHKGRLPAAGLSAEDMKALAAYIHSILALAPGQGAPPPPLKPVELKVLVGDAAAGERYFAAKCASCHSVTGDLRGIGSRDLGHAQLQNLWVAGGRGGGGGGRGGRGAAPAPPMTTRRETTVVVTLPTGQKYEGRLERIDDFMVTLTQADGTPRSFRRNGDVPKVDVRDPLEAHRNLLPIYTDKDIHDVTAYLAGVK
jgi:cytochrome c oxidase cbb3-type subunit 3